MKPFSSMDFLRIFFRKMRSITSHAKSRVDRILFSLACGESAPLLAKQIIERMNWQPLLPSNLSDFVTESVKLIEASSSTVAAPSFNGQSPFISINTFPSLSAHILQAGSKGNIIVTPYSSAFVLEDKLLLPSHIFHERTRVRTGDGGLFNLEDKFCVGRMQATTEMEQGILIGGAGAFNWYHFVIEVLPKASLSRCLPSRFDALPLLVPDECRKFPSFSSALAHFSGGRSLRYIGKEEIVGLQTLIFFDEISKGPFNLSYGEWPRIEDYSQHDSFLRSFVAEFRAKVLGLNEFTAAHPFPERRIFLTRPGIRRNYNQDELLDISSRYGFEPYSPEENSLQEQAKVFSEASAVVGPSGAAWVGMVFREKPLRGLTWLPREYAHFCGYSALSNLLGHQLDFIESKTRRALKSSGEAYVSDYEVCPFEFETALKRM